ncbi:TlpA family protein disulfide reductase [Paenibacillus sp. J5C_2022]|uniref:TlpA family protein disulfide reductase n=1 Tax=Paenibacillus sp. J5C2022 TaxID=2977129 RepID=UPI0021CF7A31|nr:TlpA disulfide reductase family protein [Paenibacillus sp. J5C2022]MCU6707620.1 TlpA family protein disulfide reductase [Paenibacillus sp. J5C2022]
MRNIVTLFIVAILFAGLGTYQYMTREAEAAGSGAVDEEFKPKAGYMAQPFGLPDLDDRIVSAGEAGDKLQLVNFWASWCGPCELEAPDLQKLHEQYGESVALYGVNSTYYDKERDARKFVDTYQFTFPVLMDREGTITNQYKVKVYPTTFLIDSEGVIRERINGVIPYEEWERLIEKWS